MILGTHPNVSITKQSGCKFCDQCVFRHKKRETVSPTKRPKKNGGNGFVALLKNSRQLGCVSKDIEQPKSNSIFHRMAQNPWGQSAACNSQKSTLRHVKIVKDRVIARCDSALRSHERSRSAVERCPNLRLKILSRFSRHSPSSFVPHNRNFGRKL